MHERIHGSGGQMATNSGTALEAMCARLFPPRWASAWPALICLCAASVGPAGRPPRASLTRSCAARSPAATLRRRPPRPEDACARASSVDTSASNPLRTRHGFAAAYLWPCNAHVIRCFQRSGTLPTPLAPPSRAAACLSTPPTACAPWPQTIKASLLLLSLWMQRIAIV